MRVIFITHCLLFALSAIACLSHNWVPASAAAQVVPAAESKTDLNAATADESKRLPDVGAATIAKVTALVAVETTATQVRSQPGMVWCNSEPKIDHQEGDRWYGKTRNGQWITEANAIKAGYRGKMSTGLFTRGTLLRPCRV